MSLPLGFVTMSQSPKVHSEWLTGSPPLLQSPLTLGLGTAPTPAATCGMMMVSQDMLTMPHVIGTLGAGLSRRALGALARLKPWGRCPAKLGKKAVILVDPDQVLLPTANDHRTVLVQYDSARIFSMAAATRGRLLVSGLVKKPVCVMDASRLGLVPCKMCLDPRHC